MKYLFLGLVFAVSILFAEVEVKKYSSGAVKSKTIMKNSQREGLAQGFYKDGTLKYETLFKKNKREGLSKSYYKNGKLKSEKIYKKGMLNGVSKTFYKNGKLKSKFNFENDLPLSGTSYNKDGSKVK